MWLLCVKDSQKIPMMQHHRRHSKLLFWAQMHFGACKGWGWVGRAPILAVDPLLRQPPQAGFTIIPERLQTLPQPAGRGRWGTAVGR